MPKGTMGEIEDRVTEVYKLLLSGVARPQILQHCASKWGVAQRASDEYIARANDRLRAQAQTDRAQEFGKALARREDLYQRSLRLQDFGKALMIDESRCRLLDLFPKKKLEVTHAHSTEDLDGLTEEDLTTLLEELDRKIKRLTKARGTTPAKAKHH